MEKQAGLKSVSQVLEWQEVWDYRNWGAVDKFCSGNVQAEILSSSA